MEGLFCVDDGDEVWQKLADEAELGKHDIATVDNLDRVNK